ncbi:MAG: PASTA domain-containing protein [Gaiellaceae bacterium]
MADVLRTRLAATTLAVGALAAASAGCGGMAATRGSVSAPAVVGLRGARAAAEIRQLGLVPRSARRLASTTVPSGLVISQRPEAHEGLAPGAVVFLVVSAGPEGPSAPPPRFG